MYEYSVRTKPGTVTGSNVTENSAGLWTVDSSSWIFPRIHRRAASHRTVITFCFLETMSRSTQQQHASDLKLNPSAVRERAKSIAGCKEVGSKGESVISFMVGLDKPGISDALARVNIFVDSGTIGTCRVMGGKVRQTFRRHVDSLDVVERLLKNPEKLLAIDDGLIGLRDEEASDASNSSPKSLQKELEFADVALCILQGEKEKLKHHLDSLSKSLKKDGRRSKSYDNDDDDSSSSSVAGLEFQFSLPANVMSQVDQCFKDIAKMEKLVKGVATNGKGTVFLYGNGGVAYTPSIPRALYQKLRELRNSSYSARPCYVSLGTRDRYFVAFNDGTADWKGPKALDKILKKCVNSGQQPRSVAFGSTYDTFFVVFSDGSWRYQGRGIPESLEEKLAARDDRADLVTVNLGPAGEWFLKARNGRMWWSGISEALDEVIADILSSGNFLHYLDFGEHDSYFVSYDE